MKNSLLILVVIVLTNSSCQKDNCARTGTAFVQSVEVPEFGVINEDINVEVKYWVSNNSGQFEKFIVSNSNNSQNIDVIASYSGCDHQSVAPTRISNYTFNVSTPGTYYLNFNTGNDSYIRDTIVIN